jgi:hypothetical protein
MAHISTKELNYVKDFLSWELYMAKVCRQYSSQFTDRNFSALIDEAGQMHQQNFQEIYNYLEQIQ